MPVSRLVNRANHAHSTTAPEVETYAEDTGQENKMVSPGHGHAEPGRHVRNVGTGYGYELGYFVKKSAQWAADSAAGGCEPGATLIPRVG